MGEKEVIKVLKKLIKWRKSVLDDRIKSLKNYIAYRKKLHEKIDDEGLQEPVFKTYLKVRKWANKYVYGVWLRFLQMRKKFFEFLPVF